MARIELGLPEPCTRVSFRLTRDDSRGVPPARFSAGHAEALIGTDAQFGPDGFKGRVIEALVVDGGLALWITIEGCTCEQ